MERPLRVREERLGQGLSQSQLATISGVNQAQLSQIETGARVPSLPTLIRLADALQIPVGQLFEEAESPKVPAPVRLHDIDPEHRRTFATITDESPPLPGDVRRFQSLRYHLFAELGVDEERFFNWLKDAAPFEVYRLLFPEEPGSLALEEAARRHVELLRWFGLRTDALPSIAEITGVFLPEDAATDETPYKPVQELFVKTRAIEGAGDISSTEAFGTPEVRLKVEDLRDLASRLRRGEITAEEAVAEAQEKTA